MSEPQTYHCKRIGKTMSSKGITTCAECVPADEYIQELQAEIERLKEVVEAVAHIGVDFGYGKFELDEGHIKQARELLSVEEIKE